MQPFGSLEMTTKNGKHSVWHFVRCFDGFYAFGGCKEDAKRFDSIDELRAYYGLHLTWGYSPAAQGVQLELDLA